MQFERSRSPTKPREWIIAPPHDQRESLARDVQVSSLVAQVLLCRGISDSALVTRFLSPQFSDLFPPDTLPGAVEAGRLLAEAVRDSKKIVIYGDYDVDGVTASAILWHTLKCAGANVDCYVPSRMEEGYGLNADALASLAAAGAQLVITVDCGITACAEAEVAQRCGLQLIITDHHHPREKLPDAQAIVHPTALGASPNQDLCGAGVALKVAWAFAQELSGATRLAEPFRTCLLDAAAFAAMGTIADIVPLTGENRLIAHFGLRRLPTLRNPGVKALIEAAGLSTQRVYDDYDIGFRLAPRLNAVGRMGHARLAVELFTTADAARAHEIAGELETHNRLRQETERDISAHAETLVVERGLDRDCCRGIVLAVPGWHAGVIGIVASRLVERFCRPTVLIAMTNGSGQGSGRSVQHFPLHEVLTACSSHLLSHGGHAMAAGVRLNADQVEPFTNAFLAEAAQRLTEQDLRPKLRLDDEVELHQITADVVDRLQQLAPHGPGNKRPRFATTVVELAAPPRTVGRDGAHLQFTVRQGNEHRKAVAFGQGAACARLSEQRRLRLAFEPMINEWNGRRTAELRVLDWQPA